MSSRVLDALVDATVKGTARGVTVPFWYESGVVPVIRFELRVQQAEDMFAATGGDLTCRWRARRTLSCPS